MCAWIPILRLQIAAAAAEGPNRQLIAHLVGQFRTKFARLDSPPAESMVLGRVRSSPP